MTSSSKNPFVYYVCTISKESRPEEMGLHTSNEWVREYGVDMHTIKSGP